MYWSVVEYFQNSSFQNKKKCKFILGFLEFYDKDFVSLVF